MLYSGVVTAIIAFALEKTIGWRVTEAQEVGGIDLADQANVPMILLVLPARFSRR